MAKPTQAELAAQIASLNGLSLPDLRTRWEALYRLPVPKAARRHYLIRAIAYRMQEEVYGGLSAAARRMLQAGIEDTPVKRKRAPASSPQIKAGSRLIREWQGTVHEVSVEADGYIYRDKQYRSLSEVAREITGTRWSGPRFFGLRPNPPKSGNPDTARPIVTDLTSRTRPASMKTSRAEDALEARP
ncbi:MAG: DUF2924 domain-containing protein [Rhodobacteraceae bacterium]|nr:DUF2924 domain-containing protein [Paracoccaceae bacterium]